MQDAVGPRRSIKKMRRISASSPIHASARIPEHCYLFAVVGAMIIEVIMLEELAREKIYEFAFFGAPLRLRGSTGSPMRLVAIPFAK